MKRMIFVLILFLSVIVLVAVFTSFSSPKKVSNIDSSEITSFEITAIPLSENPVELDKGLRAVAFEGDDAFDFFLEHGGASSDKEVAAFLTKMLSLNEGDITLETKGFACSAFSAESEGGGRIFGRNFDWYKCDALIVRSTPTKGYASVSTVNMDFLNKASPLIRVLPEKAKTFASLYAPLDGMNEKGLCVAVLMIEDSPAANQNTEKSGLTTTTAVRAILNKAATTDEAIEILREHDMHASMGLTVHFAISDASGKTVAAEYVDNQLVITESPIVTNYYLAPGKKHGKGTAQSHERFNILKTALSATPSLSESKAASLLERVCKAHWHDGETTEWSIVFNQQDLTATYFHRENYGRGWKIEVMPFYYTSP